MILAIGGKLESGKDTFADYLVKNYKFTKLAFADNLKRCCMEAFGLSYEQCYTTHGKFQEFETPMTFEKEHGISIAMWLKNKNQWAVNGSHMFDIGMLVGAGQLFHSPREVLQFVGTEVMRDCVDAEIHAKIIFQKIKREKLKDVVIADARFDNERRMTKNRGGKLILIDCIQTREQESTHRSETGLGSAKDYDLVIENDKTKGIPAFHKKIEHIMGVDIL